MRLFLAVFVASLFIITSGASAFHDRWHRGGHYGWQYPPASYHFKRHTCWHNNVPPVYRPYAHQRSHYRYRHWQPPRYYRGNSYYRHSYGGRQFYRERRIIGWRHWCR